MIVVYSKTHCPQCQQVKFALEAAGAQYEVRNIEESAAHMAAFQQLGFSAVPVTVFPSGKTVAGFEFGVFAAELGM